MDTLLSLDGLIALLTLVVMEVVLGIDNIIFISIFAGKLPKEQQPKARFIGLMLALLFRIILLISITWIISMKEPLINIDLTRYHFKDVEALKLSVRDLILLAGGIFLIVKTVTEIHHKIEDKPEKEKIGKAVKSLTQVVIQIGLIDIVFSFDSILTAIGLVNEVAIMILAVVISMIIMLLFSKYVSDFIEKHPTIKMLALSFLIMIGFMLVAEAFSASFNIHFPKGTVYFGMAFAFFVELLNMRARKKQ